jgi:hypothetical protein
MEDSNCFQYIYFPTSAPMTSFESEYGPSSEGNQDKELALAGHTPWGRDVFRFLTLGARLASERLWRS